MENIGHDGVSFRSSDGIGIHFGVGNSLTRPSYWSVGWVARSYRMALCWSKPATRDQKDLISLMGL